MAGYTRQDTSNSIANGNVADADVIDSEFNQVESAFNSSTGHTHDGTSAEGAPIEVTGPAQDFLHTGTALTPKSSNSYSLGSSTLKFKDIHVDGVGYIDAVVGNLTGDVTGNVTGNADTATTLATARTIGLTGDVTATGVSFDGSANITLTTAVGNDSHNHTLSTITDAGTIASQNSNAVSITGGTITGITDLAIADGGTGASTAAGALTNLGLTATATELNTLDGITSTVTELNYVDGVTSNVQTQLDGKLTLVSEAVITTITANIDFTLPSGYRYFRLVLANVKPNTANASLWMKFSEDSGTSYLASQYAYQHSATVRGAESYTYSTGVSILPLGTVGPEDDANLLGGIAGYVDLFEVDAASNWPKAQWRYTVASFFDTYMLTGAGHRYNGTTGNVINAIRLTTSSGGFASGAVQLYGMKEA